MEKEAWVTGVVEGAVRVRFLRGAGACHTSCVDCGGCLLPANRETEILIPVPAGHLLKPGDRVKVVMAPSGFLRGAFLVYLVPLLLFLAGYAAGERLFHLFGMDKWQEAGGMVGGIFCLLLNFAGIKLFDRRLAASGRYRLRVVNGNKNEMEA